MNINFNPSALNNGFKVKRQKFGVGSLIPMLIFGAVFAGAGFFAINNSNADPGWQRVTGEITGVASDPSDGSMMYTSVVTYSVDGQDYRATSNYSSSFAPTVGESREVAYNPAQPNQAKVVEGIGTTWWLWIFPILGLAVLIGVPIAFARSLRRSRQIRHLMQTGQKLQGVITELQSTNSTNSNGGSKIVVSAVDTTGTTQNYVSDPVSGIGALAMADFQTNPIPIDVYVDPTNPEHYYVDLADVPNLTPQRITELIQSATNRTQPQTLTPTPPTVPPVENPQPPVPKL